jgi:hypothetical protein
LTNQTAPFGDYLTIPIYCSLLSVRNGMEVKLSPIFGKRGKCTGVTGQHFRVGPVRRFFGGREDRIHTRSVVLDRDAPVLT